MTPREPGSWTLDLRLIILETYQFGRVFWWTSGYVQSAMKVFFKANIAENDSSRKPRG